MLRSLYIKNYALIDELSAEFSRGLTILTGETGAGKSIIIGALGLILGERADPSAVRSGTEKAVVEARFEITGNPKLLSLLQASAIEAADELLIRREVSARGGSRSFVNDSPVTLGVQKQIGEFLVDLHGQHEHQSLLRTETHLLMLDDFGGLEGLVGEFQAGFRHLKALVADLDDLRQREQQLREKRDFYLFQLEEIDAVGPQKGEEEALEAELNILENSERLFGATARLYEQLYEGEVSVHDLLVVARNQLHDLAEIDHQFSAAASECSSAEAIVKELAKFIQSYNAHVEFNPERLEELRDRLGRLSLLKKKYGGSIDAVLAHREAMAADILLAENFDATLARLTAEVKSVLEQCGVMAQRLSMKRHETAKRVDHAVVGELRKLGIPHAEFSTRITQADHTGSQYTVPSRNNPIGLTPTGYDQVEFYLSTNVGEAQRPLSKIASGGEVSRVMLALKSILAKSDKLPVLIFDEIDVGVSGRIAQVVGKSLKSLASFHQVIAITHLPQIAGLADAHFVVEKSARKGRAVTSLRALALEDQVREVARLMSGAEVTDAGLEGARELMGLK